MGEGDRGRGRAGRGRRGAEGRGTGGCGGWIGRRASSGRTRTSFVESRSVRAPRGFDLWKCAQCTHSCSRMEVGGNAKRRHAARRASSRPARGDRGRDRPAAAPRRGRGARGSGGDGETAPGGTRFWLPRARARARAASAARGSQIALRSDDPEEWRKGIERSATSDASQLGARIDSGQAVARATGPWAPTGEGGPPSHGRGGSLGFALLPACRPPLAPPTGLARGEILPSCFPLSRACVVRVLETVALHAACASWLSTPRARRFRRCRSAPGCRGGLRPRPCSRPRRRFRESP